MGRGDLEVRGGNVTSRLWAKPASPLIKEAKMNHTKLTARSAGSGETCGGGSPFHANRAAGSSCRRQGWGSG